MRILMLGWEFPPYIAGGLGVACYGLTRALDRLGHEVLFVLPRAVEGREFAHVTVVSPERGDSAGARASSAMAGAQRTTVEGVEAGFSSPYADFSAHIPGEEQVRERLLAEAEARLAREGVPLLSEAALGAERRDPPPNPYKGDLVQATIDYALRVVAVVRKERFDIVHAHDWLTFTAGIAAARMADKPLVVHVHSTECDRSGEEVNRAVYDIERRGMFAADRVIVVSALTKSICVRQYGVSPGKVDVVYNGVEPGEPLPPPGARIESGDRIVLFLGRITHQKGPEYFIAAAARVLEKMANVRFVVAGSGDMYARTAELAAGAGIAEKVLFTGFLHGPDVEKIFRIADCLVMPSVSEPFGLVALEAMQHGVPVIISRQSGVSEVLTHALKVDFWDTTEMADKILAVLRRPALGDTLREHGTMEVRRLTWDGAASQCLRTYTRAARERGALT
jgi:glycogen synthase